MVNIWHLLSLKLKKRIFWFDLVLGIMERVRTRVWMVCDYGSVLQVIALHQGLFVWANWFRVTGSEKRLQHFRRVHVTWNEAGWCWTHEQKFRGRARKTTQPMRRLSSFWSPQLGRRTRKHKDPLPRPMLSLTRWALLVQTQQNTRSFQSVFHAPSLKSF